MSKETFFLKKDILTNEDTGEPQEYCWITLSDGTGWNGNEYMSMTGLCSHRRGQLMSTAPDLLESLENMVKMCGHLVPNIDPLFAEKAERTLESARAAIKKATEK